MIFAVVSSRISKGMEIGESELEAEVAAEGEEGAEATEGEAAEAEETEGES